MISLLPLPISSAMLLFVLFHNLSTHNEKHNPLANRRAAETKRRYLQSVDVLVVLFLASLDFFLCSWSYIWFDAVDPSLK